MSFLFDLHKQLMNSFDMNKPYIPIDKKVVCHTFLFLSDMQEFQMERAGAECAEEQHVILGGHNPVNRSFRYAIFKPVAERTYSRAIIMLHGLNERSWDKYLTWAYKLTDFTGEPVILFPLANHINRSPQIWSFPRKMIEIVRKRQNYYGKIPNSSFVNAALSYRIDNSPEVFVSSGIQSIADIVKLTQFIKSGTHPLFEQDTEIDFFAYSIGAFVSEILLLANPLNLYSESRAFFFCGGSTFDQMDGRSKNILDNRAFSSLQKFMDHVNMSVFVPKFLDALKPLGCSTWDVFSSLLSLNRFRAESQEKLKLISDKIKAIGLTIDKVIPGDAIRKTLCPGMDSRNVTVVDFNFNYSHEMPFPMNDSTNSIKVEKAFMRIFIEAADFLGRY
jgi:hypothetical protein